MHRGHNTAVHSFLPWKRFPGKNCLMWQNPGAGGTCYSSLYCTFYKDVKRNIITETFENMGELKK